MNTPKVPAEFGKVCTLTPNELRVFLLMGAGKTTREIASTKGSACAIKTVESHITHIKERLGFKSSVAVRHYATRFVIFAEANKVVVAPVKRTVIDRHQFIGV